MKAVCWNGKQDVRVETVPDPAILNPRDAIVKITSTAICGSDLHLYNGVIPRMEAGDILGHEFMGEVVDIGKENGLRKGDRVVIPFTIACGDCFFCKRQLHSLCDNSNPDAATASTLYGHSSAGLFGYSHIFGGYAGGQAEYVRVPFADVGAFKVPAHIPDEQALFLTDIFPTGYMAAENCNIQPGDTIAVWGCGPVGQFAIRSAFLLGASRVIAIDHYPARLELAAKAGAEIIDFDQTNVADALNEKTHGMGPDACIDAVGMEAHGTSIDAVYDRVKVGLGLATDRLHALRQAIQNCRKGGTVSVPGVYGGVLDKFNFGAVFSKGLTIKTGQTNVQKYLPNLFNRIEAGEIDPSFVITHQIPLQSAPDAYKMFNEEKDRFIKIVLRPGAEQPRSERL